MNISLTQSAALVVNATAFAVLNASDRLNDFVSRITGASINRNSLAENVLYHATQLGLGMAQDSAPALFGIEGKDFVEHATNVLFSKDDTVFSRSVEHLAECAMRVQSANGAVPESMVDTVPAFATELVNQYVGKHALQQLLGIYIEKHGWDTINAQIEAQVGIDKSNSGFQDKLISAGVRAGSSFLQSVLTRATVDNPNLKLEGTPELKLAAGCLHAYLTDDANCAKVLLEYAPEKALIDEQFLSKAMDLAVAYAGHLADLAHRELERVDANFQEGVKTVSGLASTDQADLTDVEAAAEIVEPALDQLAQAKKAHQDAWAFAEMLMAAKDLLVADAESRNAANPVEAHQQRVFRAFNALFKNIPLQLDEVALLGYKLNPETAKDLADELRTKGASLTAAALVSNNGMVAANLVGTYVAQYGWGGLEEVLHLAAHPPAVEAEGSLPEHQTWLDQAIPLLTVRLAIAHLKPYIEQGDFNKENDDQYLALVKGKRPVNPY
jgi:hypothetical protein